MKEWICEEVPAMTLDGKGVSTMLHQEQELVRCKDCKYWSAERINDFNKCRRWINVGVKNFATMGDWYCADAESKSADEILMEEMDADPLG